MTQIRPDPDPKAEAFHQSIEQAGQEWLQQNYWRFGMGRRDTYMNPKDLVPRSGYIGTPAQEAAKWLRDMATDYLKGRCLALKVDEAIQNWNEVTAATSAGRVLPAAPQP